MKNVLVLGKGYISGKIEKYWKLEDYNLVRVSRSEYDYVERDGFDELINKYNPEFVINTYGYTGKPNVDACQTQEDECRLRNVRHTAWIFFNCCRHGVHFVTVSTGCVYNDETGERVFTEDDIPNFGSRNPTSSVYSKCKGEYQSHFYMTSMDSFTTMPYLLRIRMPFDACMEDDKNYINKIIKYDKLVNYKNSITYIPDLVHFIEKIVQGKVMRGIYNVVNKGGITAEEIIDLYNDMVGSQFDDDRQKTIDKWYSTDDLLSEGLMKCRRSNCVLSTDKIEQYHPSLLTAKDAVWCALGQHLNKLKLEETQCAE